jgi:hypothetical protein
MQAVVIAVVTSLASVVRSRMALQIEVLALRHLRQDPALD